MAQNVKSFAGKLIQPVKLCRFLFVLLILLHSKTTAQEQPGVNKPAQDKNCVAAEAAFAEAEQLNTQNTPESMRQAIAKYEEAGRLWQAAGERAKEADMLSQIAKVYFSLRDKSRILDVLTGELVVRRAIGDRPGEAAALHNLGEATSWIGEKRKALDYFQQALDLWRVIGKPRGEAAALTNIGMTRDDLGEKNTALEAYNQALPLWQSLGERNEQAATLQNIGVIYNSLGERDKALQYYEQALTLYREVKDRRGEAVVLSGMGRVYDLSGKKQQALEKFNQSLLIRREVRDRQGEAQSLSGISSLLYTLGEKEMALDHLSQALPLYQEVGDKRGEGATLSNLGRMYAELGKAQKAIAYLTQSLQILQTIGDRYGEAYTLTRLGDLYKAQNEKQKALEYYERALPLRRAVGDRLGEIQTIASIANLRSATIEREKIVDDFKQILELSRAIKYPSGEAGALYNLAVLERDRENFFNARSFIEPALGIIDSLRTEVAAPQWRASYFASAQEYYQFYIALLMQLHKLEPEKNYAALALQASEHTRARNLLETLAAAKTSPSQVVDPELFARAVGVQQQLNTREQQRMQLLSRAYNENQVTLVDKEIRALLVQYREIQGQIHANDRRYAALIQPQPLSAKEIQEQALDDDTMLLEYALGEKRSFLWAVTPTSLISFELPGRAVVDSVARRMYNLLTARGQVLPNETKAKKSARVAQADAALPKVTADLSQMLLGPVAELLGTKRLLIVSEDALQYIPFGALPIPGAQPPATQYQPLITAHEIVSLPSASVLAVLRRELGARKSAAKTVAVIADPVFVKSDPRIKTIGRAEFDVTTPSNEQSPLTRSARETGTTFSRLIYSRREAEAIIKLAPAGEGKKAIDFAANRETATGADLSQYRIVHFATHGLLNSEHPELSGIVLSLVNENGEERDGFLRLHEIYNLDLPADLVVLSACQTALGKEIRGEGLIGLTRGFMYAGTARVAASLWSVGDAATAELMKSFYAKMLGKDPMRPATALRAAQVELWKSKRWTAPYYWAGFVLQGEWK